MKRAVRQCSGTFYVNDVNITKEPKCDCGNAAEFIVAFFIGEGGKQHGELLLCGECKAIMAEEDEIVSSVSLTQALMQERTRKKKVMPKREQGKIFAGKRADVFDVLLAKKGERVTLPELADKAGDRTRIGEVIKRIKERLRDAGHPFQIVRCERGGYMLEEL